VSPDVEIFIQSGDLVKGGKQDRLLAFDVVVPPKSGKMPITAFCVEAGRWQQRGTESRVSFGSASAQAVGKDLKLAAKASSSPTVIAGLSSDRAYASGAIGDRFGPPVGQTGVWKEVAALQKKLKRNLQSEVQADQSKSSLQLTLENQKVQEAAEKYVTKLSPILNEKEDVVG
jgi:hypothetical protein